MEHAQQEKVNESGVPHRKSRANRWGLRLGERRVLLVLGDGFVAILALLGALLFWGSRLRFIAFNIDFLRQRVPGWFYLLPLVWMVLLVELYDMDRATDLKKTVRGVATAATIGFGMYLGVYFAYAGAPNSLPRSGVGAYLLSVALLTLVWRWFFIRLNTLPAFQRRVILVGGGRAGMAVIKVIKNLDPPPFAIVGIIDDDVQKQGLTVEGCSVLGSSDTLRTMVTKHHVSDILVAISGEMQSQMFQALIEVQELGVDIIRMPRVYEEILGRVPIRLLEADWILRSFVDEMRISGFYSLMKRLVDIIGAVLGLLFLALLLPFISLAILLDDGPPIFYAQSRAGRNGHIYNIIKLRTMYRDAELNGRPQWAKEHDERTTRVGRFLRRTHMDELPQFWNVLRGEMSLVGPRAERPELIDMFEGHVPFYRARLLVKPGITGWAQINFGYAATIEETVVKLEYDLYYIKNRNIWLDLIILLRTPGTMMGFRGR